MLEQAVLDVELLKKAKIFHCGSISLIEDPCRTAHLAAMDIVKKAKAFVSYDHNLRLALWPSEDAARHGIMSVWHEADMIKVLFRTLETFCTEVKGKKTLRKGNCK